MKPVIYEPHPVTPERKAELKAQGFRIVDARFAPPEEAEKVRDALEARADALGVKYTARLSDDGLRKRIAAAE